MVMSADLEKAAADLFESGRFLDASGKFDAAAQAAKDSGEPVDRVRRLRGWARLSFGRYVTSQPEIAASPEKLTQAAEAFSDAKELLDNELAKQTAYGFMSWMLGHRALLMGSFIEGTSHCRDAKQALSQVLDTPGLPDGFRSSIGDSIRRINWDLLDGEIMRSSVQPDAIGEAKALLEALKPDMPEDRARVYEFQIAVIAPVLAGYEGGLTLAERWDPNAKKYFEDMSQPLKSWREKDDVLGDRWRPSLAHMAGGWQLVSQGEIHHANALRELFERGAPMAAKNEIGLAADAYRQAEREFGQAGMPGGMISRVRDRADLLDQRSKALSEATASHQIWTGMGRWFVGFFLIALAALTAAQWLLSQHLDLWLTVWSSLFVGLVGGFTKHAPMFLDYLAKRGAQTPPKPR